MPRHDKPMRRALRLAARHGVRVGRYRPGRGWWISHPAFYGSDHDPRDGTHYAQDGREVLQSVRAYIRALARR